MEKRINFLSEASEKLSSNEHTKKLLRSYYLMNLKRFVSKKASVSNVKFGKNERCKKCCTPWFDGDFKVKYVEKNMKSNRERKLVDLLLHSSEKLSKKQKVRAKWYRKRINSCVILTCDLCHTKTTIFLDKINEKKKDDDKKEEPEEIPTKIKRKKRKKDRTAGLKKEYLNKSIKITPPQPSTSKVENDKKAQNLITKISNKSLIIKNNKIKKKSTTNRKPVNQPISKTQQKNALLQLANILKNSSKSNTDKNNRLKNLLR